MGDGRLGRPDREGRNKDGGSENHGFILPVTPNAPNLGSTNYNILCSILCNYLTFERLL